MLVECICVYLLKINGYIKCFDLFQYLNEQDYDGKKAQEISILEQTLQLLQKVSSLHFTFAILVIIVFVTVLYWCVV